MWRSCNTSSSTLSMVFGTTADKSSSSWTVVDEDEYLQVFFTVELYINSRAVIHKRRISIYLSQILMIRYLVVISHVLLCFSKWIYYYLSPSVSVFSTSWLRFHSSFHLFIGLPTLCPFSQGSDNSKSKSIKNNRTIMFTTEFHSWTRWIFQVTVNNNK